MAALRKKDRSPFFFACFTLPDGRRVQRSTKETLRKKAMEKADKWEALSKDRAKARQAHRVISEIYRAAHGEELPNSTARGYMTGWLERRKGEIAPASYAAYQGRALHFLEWLAEKAERPLGEIETRQIVSYRDALAKKRTASTANQGIKILRVIFEDARRDGYVAENPAKDCGLLKKTSGTSRRPFAVDEIRAVLGVADEEWRSMIYFGLYTGQRLADIARLSWANLDTVAGEIHLRTSKTGRVVRIPICGPLMRHIETLPAGDRNGSPLHPRAAGHKSSTLSRQFSELLADAGLATARNHEAAKDGRGAKRSLSEISFHSLRHTATSMMKNAGTSPAVVQDIIGHESAEISAHYTHIESPAKLEALEKLPDITTTARAVRTAGK